MLAIITSALALISEIAPTMTAVGTIAKVIDNLEALVPAIVQDFKDLKPTVQLVIDTVRGTTDDQTNLDRLDAIEAVLDADSDAADAAAKAEDDAAGN